MDGEQKIYELGYLLTPLIPEDGLDGEISVLRNLIENKHGLIISEEKAKMHRLAYTIIKRHFGRFDSAYFGWVKFMAVPEMIGEIEKDFKKLSNIVRFIILDITKEESIKKMPTAKAIKRKRPVIIKEAKPKEEIKTEEIDKKLEELLASH